VTTCCEIYCFSKTTTKKLGTDTLLVSPNLKVWGPVSPPVPTVVAHMPIIVFRLTGRVITMLHSTAVVKTDYACTALV